MPPDNPEPKDDDDFLDELFRGMHMTSGSDIVRNGGRLRVENNGEVIIETRQELEQALSKNDGNPQD
jgi:hypothetical protein